MGTVISAWQCLFGYDDGHRLLAASRGLDADVVADLRVPSDLAPGATVLEDEGYWTGLPVAQGRFYALMHTWPAPECPRPGCVWTHALVMSAGELRLIGDLSSLRRYFARPHLGDQSRYAAPISVSVEDEHGPRLMIASSDALRSIRATYGDGSRGVVDGLLAPADTMFAIWSQQWPELRRRFAFRSLSTSPRGETGIARFDLRVGPVTLAASGKASWRSPIPTPWEAVAVEELVNGASTEFREFLWRYGPSTRRGTSAFRPLATAYAHFVNGDGDMTDEDVISLLFHAFPKEDQASELKRDLLWSGQAPTGLSLDPIRSWLALMRQPEWSLGPASIEGPLGELFSLWSARPSDAMRLAAAADHSDSAVAHKVLEALGRLDRPPNLAVSTSEWSALRRAFVRANPSLLDSDAVGSIASEELADLLQLVPEEDESVEHIIDRLMVVDDASLATSAFARFPRAACLAIAHRVGERISSPSVRISWAWRLVVSSNADQIIQQGIAEMMRSTADLARLADVLGQENPKVMAEGCGHWAAALETARDNVVGDDRYVFLAFLMILALANHDNGAEKLLETSFEPLHLALSKDSLPPQAFRLLLGSLPSLSWWQQWDTCLRLRTAVVDAYIAGNLAPTSFARLAALPEISNDLARQAERTAAGQRLLGGASTR